MPLHGSFLTHSISDRKSRKVRWLLPDASAATVGDTPVNALCRAHADVLLGEFQSATSDRAPVVNSATSSSLSPATSSHLPQIVEEERPAGHKKVSISAAGQGVDRPVAVNSTDCITRIDSFMRQVQRADAFQLQSSKTAGPPLGKPCNCEKSEALCRLHASSRINSVPEVGTLQVLPTSSAFKSSAGSSSGGLPLNANESTRACDAKCHYSNECVDQRQTAADETNSSTHASKTATADDEETHTTTATKVTVAPGARVGHWKVADLMAALDNDRLRTRVVEARREKRRTRQQLIDCTMTSSLDRRRFVPQVAPAVVDLSTCSPYFVSSTQQKAGGCRVCITESPTVALRSTPVASDGLPPDRSNSVSATVIGNRSRSMDAERSTSSQIRISISDAKFHPANLHRGATKADAAVDDAAGDRWVLHQRLTPRESDAITAGSHLLLQPRSRQLRQHQGTICAADRRKCASLPAVLSIDGVKSGADAVYRSVAVPLLRRGTSNVDGARCKRIALPHHCSNVPSASGNEVATGLMTVGLVPTAGDRASHIGWPGASKRTTNEQYERDNRP
jgi:hypothetical protein